ncbi:DUF1849 family protein [Reyranella sp.]|uniref:EipB family protein n=1 Tax=Reyranella sp. TaxID=1929291 RepID=UPI0025ED5C41|nr:DUF1849 family protein [Reyranella sp.]
MKAARPFLIVIVGLLVSHVASAQPQPHRAEYSLRLGTAANAPRVGTAVQDLTSDCNVWRIQRRITSDVSLTPSFKVDLAFRSEGEEDGQGKGLRYSTFQFLNGAEHQTKGTLRRTDGEIQGEIATREGTEPVSLPPLTMLPVAALGHLVHRLAEGANSFSMTLFAAEAAAAFLVDVEQLPLSALPPAPPSLVPPTSPPTGRSWGVLMTVTRAGAQDGKPSLSMRARVFESGVLDQIVVVAGPAIIAAHLRALDMHKERGCSGG